MAQLGHLTHRDVDQAAALSRGVGWFQTPDDWARLLTLAPDGVFARAGLRVERRLTRMALSRPRRVLSDAPIWAAAGLEWG